MNATDRRLKIFNIIYQEKSVNVVELSKMFDVTSMTIRRDLALLEKQGILTTNYGGAIFNSGTAIEPSFFQKSTRVVEGKKKIGEAVTHFVKNGDSVFFDCGSTVVQVAKSLPDVHITAITNSLPVCNVLKAYPNIKLIVVGGRYDSVSDGFVGSTVIETLAGLNIDKAIIGTQGFSVERGLTVPDEDDAALKAAIVKSSRLRILAVDHEKTDEDFLVKFAEVSDFDYIVTDKGPGSSSLDFLRSRKVKLVVTDGFCTIDVPGEKQISIQSLV